LEQKRAQKVQDRIIDRYRFLVPQTSDNTAFALQPEQQTLAKEIASLLTGAAASGSTVNITPYSFGDKAMATSVERFAKSLLEEIKRHAPMLSAQAFLIESATELTAPETPQERILARSLLLTIERPIPQSPQERRGR
jgi:hypothetical protein